MDPNTKLPFAMPNYDLTGKVAIVTGGTKGIGYGVVMTLAYYGAKVVVTSRHQDDCDNVAKEVTALGGNAVGIKTDVRSKAEIDNLVAGTVEKYGKLDIMVNNAGVAITKPMLEMSEEEYNTVLDSNLRSVYFGSAAAAKEMIKQGHGGRIINMASIGGLIGTKNISTYGASKAAVLNLTKGMAIEFGKYNITVNSVCPGYVKTALNAEVLDNPKYQEKMFHKIPLKRWGTIPEVAAIVLFLASDFSGIMTGSYLVADMGTTCG
ncbi:SDR family NAD(P)-dependent oxidoreductase [Caproicibacter sp. BJN0012]|uniref:SDR family NAD(P)-dependent oxidoreductase n=1 Tax=Caproicibacter sp. BJN0012 TaxID=3110227 RepID=UPI002E12B656